MPKRQRQGLKEQRIQPPESYSSVVLTTENDIYNTMHQNYCLSLEPPTHWLNDVPTFSKDQLSLQALLNQNDDSPQELLTIKLEPSVETLLSHLNEIKAKLEPYAEIISDLKQSRSMRTTPQNEFRRASRNKSVNPFESLSLDFDGMPLISRSALKLCNIDALLGFNLCCRRSDSHSQSIFVDLCGAPGGFSQYMIFRGMKKGYGMSLTGQSNDSVGLGWEVDILDKQRFQVHSGKDGTGDLYQWDNVISLQQKMETDTGSGKAALVVADGGLDAQRNSDDQEGIAYDLIICEMASSLRLLGSGGHFVIKMFGFRNKKTRDAMLFLASVFECIKVIKPIASRPASTERYVVGFNFQGLAEDFDPCQWRDGMLSENCTQKLDKSVCFEQFLDRVDHDIASLNIRACSSIIECFRLEELKVLHRKRKTHDPNFQDEVNVDHIRKTWNL